LITGRDFSGKDFNDLGNETIIGTGSYMTNDPINNQLGRYLVLQICAGSLKVQLAKLINWSVGELFYFRQFNESGTWSNWERFGLSRDIISLQESVSTINSQRRKCKAHIFQQSYGSPIYVSATIQGVDKGVIEIKGADNYNGGIIFTLVEFNPIITQKVRIKNLGDINLTLVENSISLVKDTSTSLATVKFAFTGMNQWANMDFEFPVNTREMIISSSEIV
jgi:hypothetical protein